MSRPSALYRLQRVDTQLDARQAHLADLEAKLASRPAVQKAREELSAVQAQVAVARRNAKTLEQESQSLTEKILEIENQLYGGRVTNPRELKDLQAEAESLKRRRGSVDDEQLAAMELVEAAERSEAAARQTLSDAEAARAIEASEFVKEKSTVEAAIAKLSGEREAAVSSVRPDDLEIYDSLRKRKRGTAVALLDDGVCSACGVAPSSSRIQAARRSAELVYCSNCERILYAEQGAVYTDTGDRDDEMIERW